MDGYVTKPVVAEQLVDAVERAAGTLDLVAAAAHVRGNERLLRDMLAIVLAECPRLLSDIRKAIEASDATALRLAAHALKGSVANFAASQTVEAARKLEKIGIDGDLSDARAAFHELELALDGFRREASKETSS